MLDQGKADEAEKLFRESLAIMQRVERRHPELQKLFPILATDARIGLGASLVEQGRYVEGEALLLGSYQLLSSDYEKMPNVLPGNARLLRAAGRILKLYLAWNKPDEVVKWQGILLDNQVTISFNDPPLNSALQILARKARTDIRLDLEGLKQADIAPNSKVLFKMQGTVSLRSCLSLLLSAHDLALEEDKMGLLVTTRKATPTRVDTLSEVQQACARRIENVLDGQESFDLQQQSLTDVARYLEQATSENFVLDPAARRAGLLDPMIKVSGSATAVPLREGLQKLLDPVGLTIVVRDEVVVITPKTSTKAKQ